MSMIATNSLSPGEILGGMARSAAGSCAFTGLLHLFNSRITGIGEPEAVGIYGFSSPILAGISYAATRVLIESSKTALKEYPLLEYLPAVTAFAFTVGGGKFIANQAGYELSYATIVKLECIRLAEQLVFADMIAANQPST